MRIGYPDPLLIHPGEENLMFMAGARTSPAGWRTTQTADAAIARSQDGGRNWEVLQGGLPPHLHGDVEAMALEAWNGSCQFTG